jgi:hypothetical protein
MWQHRTVSISVIALLLVAANAVGQSYYDFKSAQYLMPGEGGKKGNNIDGVLRFDEGADQILFLAKGKSTALTIPYASVKSLLYERSAKPRYAAGLLIAWPLIFTKSKGHYLTIQYADPSGEGKFAIIRLHKSNFREAVARAEAATGQKVERQEEK